MPDVKTSDETAATALDGTELARIVQGGNSRKATFQQIKTYVDGGLSNITTDADLTLTVFVDDETQRHTGTLTADRTITLSHTDAYSGATFHITRTGGGAFNLIVADGGTLKALATDTWATFRYGGGSAWRLIAAGAL